MNILLGTLLLLLGAVSLAAIARRIGVPSPSLFALGGVLLALIPNGPRISLEPDLALALFLAPVLMDAAFDSSLRDLRENWLPLTSLVFIAVAMTTSAIALVAHWLVPAMPWAAAVALGAAVAPPDAAAATAVLKEVALPHRLLAILEGESLLNDASSLLIYRLAVATALARAGSPAAAVSTLAFILIGSVAAGAVFAFALGSFINRVSHVPSSIVLQFIGTFGMWILADKLGLSGVLVIVTAAIIVSRRAIRMPAAVRVPSYAVWEAVVFVLNALAFILAGLQLGPILDRLSRGQHPQYITFAMAILATVILTRAGWVTIHNIALRLTRRVLKERTPRAMAPPPFRPTLVVGWCGMRGIVTLATALALPEASGSFAGFPYRDLIVLAAFTVVLGTLVIQGLTLRPLLTILGLEADALVESEVRAGRKQIFKAALETLAEDDTDVAAALRSEFAQLLEQIDGTGELSPEVRQAELALRAAIRTAARETLNRLRLTGAIGDQAFQTLEAELDVIELGAEVRDRW